MQTSCLPMQVCSVVDPCKGCVRTFEHFLLGQAWSSPANSGSSTRYGRNCMAYSSYVQYISTVNEESFEFSIHVTNSELNLFPTLPNPKNAREFLPDHHTPKVISLFWRLRAIHANDISQRERRQHISLALLNHNVVDLIQRFPPPFWRVFISVHDARPAIALFQAHAVYNRMCKLCQPTPYQLHTIYDGGEGKTWKYRPGFVARERGRTA